MSRRPLLRRTLAATPLLLALALAGCGVPTGEDVTVVESQNVPYRLLEPRASAGSGTSSAAPPAGTSTAPPQAGTSSAYFVDGERLVPVTQPVTSPVTGVALADVMTALSMGPDPTSQESGLGTTLPPSVRLMVLRFEDGTATIELQSDEVSNVGEQGPLATAQIVLSATSVPGVDRVLLTRLGTPIEAQLADGALTTRPLTSADYAGLIRAGSAA